MHGVQLKKYPLLQVQNSHHSLYPPSIAAAAHLYANPIGFTVLHKLWTVGTYAWRPPLPWPLLTGSSNFAVWEITVSPIPLGACVLGTHCTYCTVIMPFPCILQGGSLDWWSRPQTRNTRSESFLFLFFRSEFKRLPGEISLLAKWLKKGGSSLSWRVHGNWVNNSKLSKWSSRSVHYRD